MVREEIYQEVLDYFISLKRHRRIAPSYLFVGHDLLPFTRRIVQLCNCQVSDSACGQCRHCRFVEQEMIPDFFVIDEPSSIKIDQIRAAQQFLSTKPSFLVRKTLVINQAHMMTEEASHAFLKTLEEPPKGVLIILISSRIDKLFPTIISRCRRIYFPQKGNSYAFDGLDRINRLFLTHEVNLKERRASRRTLQDIAVLLRDALVFGILQDKKLLLAPSSYEIILPLKNTSNEYIECLEETLKIYNDLDTINLNLAAQLVNRALKKLH